MGAARRLSRGRGGAELKRAASDQSHAQRGAPHRASAGRQDELAPDAGDARASIDHLVRPEGRTQPAAHIDTCDVPPREPRDD